MITLLQRVVRTCLPFTALVMANAASLSAQPVSGERPDWSTSRPADVRFADLVLVGGDSARSTTLLIVGSEEDLSATNLITGDLAWRRMDLGDSRERDVAILPLAGVAIVETGEDEVVLSLRTGTTLWSSVDLPFREIRAYVPLLAAGMFLVAGRDSSDAKRVAGVLIRSGEVIWQDGIWEKDPEVRGGSARDASSVLPPILVINDSTVVTWATRDGPTAIDPLNGTVRWIATDLEGKKVPSFRDSSPRAAWRLTDHGIVAFYDDDVALLNPSDGHAEWISEVRDPVGWAQIVGSAILLEGWNGNGRAFFDLLDLPTGEPRWAEPIKNLKAATTPLTNGSGDVWFVSEEGLHRLDIDVGAYERLLDIHFEAGEKPGYAASLGGGAIMGSEQNVLAVGPTADLKYQKYYDRPDKNTLRTILKIGTWVNRAMLVKSSIDAFQGGVRVGQLCASPSTSYSSCQALRSSQERWLESVHDQFAYTEQVLSSITSHLAQRFGETSFAHSVAAFLTKRENRLGEDCWVAVVLDLSTGEELHVVEFEDKPRHVWVDGPNALLVAQLDDRAFAGWHWSHPPDSD